MAVQTACEPWCYVVSVALLAFYLCILLATRATVQHIDEVDKSIQQNTAFIKNLILKLEALKDEVDGSQQEEIKSLISLARFSNLQSCEASKEIEVNIVESVDELDSAIQNNDHDAISKAVDQMSKQLKQRDRICKVKNRV